MPRYRGLQADLQVDVAIVGAGISGACMARALTARGCKVAILDRRIPMMGSTAASTALLVYDIDRPLFSLARDMGVNRARRAWQRSYASVGDLRRLVSEDGISCQWKEQDSLLLAGTEFGSRALRTEVRARASAGLEARFVTAAELNSGYGIDRTGAILGTGSAVADPLQLTAGLLRAAARRGARLYSPVDVTAVTSGGGEVRLTTGNGFTVTAEHVVFCTGYEVLRGVPSDGHRVRSTWVFASAAEAQYPDWLDETMVWEASEPYLYLRTTNEGRLIVGGEDEGHGDRHNNRRVFDYKIKTLEKKVRRLLPGVRFRVQYRWAGSFGDSDSGLPTVDQVPGLPGCHVVMGFGGNGIINSMIASQLIASAIDGKVDPDADLYRLPSVLRRTG